MKIKVAIIAENNLLERTLKQIPELSNFEFSTEKTEYDSADHYLISEEISNNSNNQNSFILKKPIDVNTIINYLVSLFKDKDHPLGLISFNFRKRIFFNDTRIIDLTELEASLFESILNSEKMQATKQELIHGVLGYSKDAETKTLENHLYKLKAKLKELGTENLLHLEGDNISIHLKS